MRNQALLSTATTLVTLALLGSAACTDAKDGTTGTTPGDGTNADASPGSDAGGGEAGPRTGPIAPDCTDPLAWCAQVEASASVACRDVDQKPYTITTSFSGKTDNVSCSVHESGDLELILGPAQSHADYGTHWVRFRMRGYHGAGTYELTRGANEDIDHGFELQGATSGSLADERAATAGTAACGPSPCKAIVAPESQPIPNGDSVQEFRLRVEVQCDPAGRLWWHPDCRGSDCTFVGTPSMHFDVQCTH